MNEWSNRGGEQVTTLCDWFRSDFRLFWKECNLQQITFITHRMKWNIRIVIGLSLLASLPISAQNKDIETLTNLNKAWIDSYPRQDTATLKEIFADDFVLISPAGTKMTKQNILSNLSKQKISSAKVDSVQVRLLTKDVGIVTAYTTFVLSAEEKEVTGKNCYQDVYVKRKGKWFAVSAHVTLLNLK
jgi:uncharacterized protein (TIGR02246 family)